MLQLHKFAPTFVKNNFSIFQNNITTYHDISDVGAYVDAKMCVLGISIYSTALQLSPPYNKKKILSVSITQSEDKK